jgi:hypothetical protein
MIRVSHLLLAAVTAATLVGCGYPETKMEEVGQPQLQTQKTPAPAVTTPAAAPAPEGEKQAAEKDKTKAGS